MSNTKLPLRERQVIQLAADGLENNEIAARLNISPSAITAYFARIYKRLGVRQARQEAIYRFLRGDSDATT